MALLCPSCKQCMVLVKVGTVVVDVCKLGCKGIWFDAGEIQPLTKMPTAGMHVAFEEALNAPPRIYPAGFRRCPRCQKVMGTIEYGGASVTADSCTNCGGIFLDAGELQHIYQDYSAKAARAEGLRHTVWDREQPGTASYLRRRLPYERSVKRTHLRPAPLERNIVLQQELIDQFCQGLLFVLSCLF